MFCSCRNRNGQLSRKKTLFRAWIRRECCVKPLANEFNGLMHLNSCLFKIQHSNIYINLKEADIFHCSCFTWNIILVKCLGSAVVSRETKCGEYWITRRLRFHVKQIRVILFFNKTERNKGFLIRNEVCLKNFENYIAEKKKNLENKEKIKTNRQYFA